MLLSRTTLEKMINVKDIYMRDPFVFVEDDTVYLVGTTDEQCWGGKASGFLGYKSKDLVNFEGPYVLFAKEDDFWSDENYWAPELHKIDNKYLLIASFYKKGMKRRSQILISDSPLGKYKPVNTPFTPGDWMSLDATLWKEDSKLYTVFCHEWVQVEDGEMILAELNNDYSSIKGDTVKLFTASEAPWVIRNNECGKSGFVTDGPFIHKLKNGNLAMLWSSHGKEGYACGVSISTNGIKGPWKHLEEPLFKKDGGHGMIFTFNGKTYLSLHCPNAPHLEERPHFYEVVEENNILRLK